MEVKELTELIGKTILEVKGMEPESEEIVVVTKEGWRWPGSGNMIHTKISAKLRPRVHPASCGLAGSVVGCFGSVRRRTARRMEDE